MAFPFLSRITFNADLGGINAFIQKEHASWIEKEMPQVVRSAMGRFDPYQYGILNYPALWSDARFFETPIDLEPSTNREKNSAFDEITKHIDKAKQENPQQKEEIVNFEKKYKKYFELLKERCLLKTIQQLLTEVKGEQFDEVKASFQGVLSTSALLNMQTRFECLQAHRDVTLLYYAFRNKAESEKDESQKTANQEKIKQLEIIAKRLLDVHYQSAKKITLGDAIAKDVSAVTSYLGLATGISAFTLALLAIAFPPLAIPAGILGFISYISYASTIIYTANMAYEAIKYGRGPNPSDVKWFIADVILLPLYTIGGVIFSKIANAFHSLKAQIVINTVGSGWNNILSNIFPDIFFAKEVAADMAEVGSAYTAEGQLKNTLTASSWKKMESAFVEQDGETFTKVRDTKVAIFSRSKTRLRLANNEEYNRALEELKLCNSEALPHDTMKEISNALANFLSLEKFTKPMYLNQNEENQYYQQCQKQLSALAEIANSCRKFDLAHPSANCKAQNQLSQQIQVLVAKLDNSLIANFATFTNTSQLGATAIQNRDFAFVRITPKQLLEPSLPVTKSYHGHILLWDLGFKGLRTSFEAQAIKDSIAEYKQLKPDCEISARIGVLDTIKTKCQNYLTQYADDKTKKRVGYVQNLAKNVQNEIDNLNELNTEADNKTTVLLGFKAR